MSFEFGVAQLAKSHDSIVESRQKKTMSGQWVREKQKCRSVRRGGNKDSR